MNDEKSEGWGLAACGVSDGVTIDLDHTIDTPERWRCDIRASPRDLIFEVKGPGSMRDFLDFMNRNQGQNTFESLRIGWLASGDVVVIKDDEFDDRFFLRVTGESSMGVRFTFVGDDTRDLCNALKSLVEDLPE